MISAFGETSKRKLGPKTIDAEREEKDSANLTGRSRRSLETGAGQAAVASNRI